MLIIRNVVTTGGASDIHLTDLHALEKDAGRKFYQSELPMGRFKQILRKNFPQLEVKFERVTVAGSVSNGIVCVSPPPPPNTHTHTRARARPRPNAVPYAPFVTMPLCLHTGQWRVNENEGWSWRWWRRRRRWRWRWH